MQGKHKIVRSLLVVVLSLVAGLAVAAGEETFREQGATMSSWSRL